MRACISINSSLFLGRQLNRIVPPSPQLSINEEHVRMKRGGLPRMMTPEVVEQLTVAMGPMPPSHPPPGYKKVAPKTAVKENAIWGVKVEETKARQQTMDIIMEANTETKRQKKKDKVHSQGTRQ